MSPPASSPASLRFGPYKVDLSAGEVRKNGLRIHVQEQPFQILTTLLEHPGEVVTRDELRRRLWPDNVFIDFDVGLNKAINKLREALCDSAEHPRYIETLPRRGYRFIAPVAPTPSVQAKLSDERPRRRWRIAASGAVLGGLLVATLALYYYTGLLRRAPKVHHNLPAVTHSKIESIAVLPLENLSRDPDQEYFADGLADTLITHLAAVPSVRVVSRQSTVRYKHSNLPLPEIGRELKVDAVVEGTVQRSGHHLHINIQIVMTETDRHLWAKTYESNPDNVLTTQEEVTRDVVHQVATVFPKSD